LAKIATPSLEQALSKAGALAFLDIGESRQAVLVAYQWLLKDLLPEEMRIKDAGETTNLYDMLSYLLERADALGFSCDSKTEQGKMVFVIRSKMRDSKTISIFLELLLAHIFEKLGRFESEITHTDTEMIAKINLI
jgi:hypothetical protein